MDKRALDTLVASVATIGIQHMRTRSIGRDVPGVETNGCPLSCGRMMLIGEGMMMKMLLVTLESHIGVSYVRHVRLVFAQLGIVFNFKIKTFKIDARNRFLVYISHSLNYQPQKQKMSDTESDAETTCSETNAAVIESVADEYGSLAFNADVARLPGGRLL